MSLPAILFYLLSQANPTPQTDLSKVQALQVPNGTIYWIDKADEPNLKQSVLFWKDDSVNDVIYDRTYDDRRVTIIDYGNDGNVDVVSAIEGRNNQTQIYLKKDKANAKLYKMAQDMYTSILRFLEPWRKKQK